VSSLDNIDSGRARMKPFLLALGLVGLLAGTQAQAGGLTPGSRCSNAGIAEGDPFRETCVSRVFRERKRNFWRNEAPMILAGGIVAGIAANGGTAFAIVTRRREAGLYQLEVDGEGFLVRVAGDGEATVRSRTKYKNVGESDAARWVKAAEQASGCTVTRRVRDFDALYAWLQCERPSPPAAPALPMTAVHAQPPQQSQPAAQSPVFVAEEIARLAALRDRGLLTAAEFETAKQKLLKR
jgi:hypothetical protein